MTITATSITVLIPARNAQATLAETLDSLAQQTLKNFEVLLVDDGSTDNTLAIARSFQNSIAIETLSLASSQGVAGALNAGLSKIQSPYIARLDADDIARTDRLEKQWTFLEQNSAVDVCSTWMELFYESTEQPNRILVKPQDDAAIKTALIQYCSMSHGASMFRKSFFDDVGHFDTRLDFAEDYDLWCRGALLGKNYTNLQEPLTLYRQHSSQVGQKKRQLQYERDLIIKRKYISALLGGASAGHLAEFFSLLCAFSSKDIALQVVEESFPILLRLGQRVWDMKTYSDIVSTAIGRHLR